MIYFVGAGSGAADLITVRGARLLREADAIIYAGSLVSEELLHERREGALVYNSAYMTLDEVIEVMVEMEKQQKMTVRLHTGDPSLYGAIREQMDRLDELGFAYDICPGVSSFSAAAAALKAEYTLPSVSQSVIITRMAGRTPVPELESIRRFAAHQCTMVIFLSASLTEKLQEELLEGGYQENTPVAIVYRASWPDEKIIRCTVGTLHESALHHEITRHALIVVGDFLGDEYETSLLYDPAFSTGYREAKK
ncbi:MAG TPA: precorrin-4 C(11)-methyltransferase [Tissierellia bacterium]|jgi:precorrin-4/cobalt-precorrin-4 C11-methyltransferase|nr:precorrin-4 C(11)-methyltransferase [Tissierellia bacterium]